MATTIVDDTINITCLSIFARHERKPCKIYIRGSISDEMIRTMEKYVDNQKSTFGIYESARDFLKENDVQICQVFK